jgi:hypothetical protein
MTGFYGGAYGIAKAAGAEVGMNPTSSDFLKIKVGNIRIDPLAGFQQYIRAASQIIAGKYTSVSTGQTKELGEGYKPLTKLDIAGRIVQSKLSPVASFATTLAKGQDWQGNHINIPKEVLSRFVPMVIADTVELAKDNPSLLPLEALGVLGLGVQTYKPQSYQEKMQSKYNENIRKNLNLGGKLNMDLQDVYKKIIK